MKTENGAMDCATESPMRDAVRKKVCSSNEADLDPIYVVAGSDFRQSLTMVTQSVI